MKNIYLSLLAGALLLFGLASCEDTLDIPQKGVLDYSFYYQTDEHAEAASNALYIQLKGTYYNYTMLTMCGPAAVVVTTMQNWRGVTSFHSDPIRVSFVVCGRAITASFTKPM